MARGLHGWLVGWYACMLMIRRGMGMDMDMLLERLYLGAEAGGLQTEGKEGGIGEGV